MLRRLRRLAGMSETPALTADDVVQLAHLARLELAPEALPGYVQQLGDILEAVRRVGEVAVEEVPPMSHPQALSNVMRPDVVVTGLTPQQALAAAPAVEDGRFRVPRILDEESGA